MGDPQTGGRNAMVNCMNGDWYQPVMTVPDVLPHGAEAIDDPSQGIGHLIAPDRILRVLTQPGPRPQTFLQGQNYALPVDTKPTPIAPNRIVTDGFVVDVHSDKPNSVFFGYGTASLDGGTEVRPGFPLVFVPDNTREQWELQRSLEYIAAILAVQANAQPLPIYRSPRVVVDPSSYFLIAPAPTTVSIMLLLMSEFQ